MPIVTVIAAGKLDDSLLGAVEQLIGRFAVEWIDHRDAADLLLARSAKELRHLLRPLEDRADIIVHERDERTPVGLFVADMDSTIIGQECIDELADYAGVKPEVAEITERAMRGDLDFPAALRERVALLEGLDQSTLARCLVERVTPNPGAEILLATLKREGVHSLLVSGGFTDFVEPIAARLGFDGFRANQLEADGQRLTGRTSGPVIDSIAKWQALDVARGALGLTPAATMAVGDGANDAAMVAAAGIGVAYHPKPALAAVADGAIRHHDLTALLWAAGIPKARWTA